MENSFIDLIIRIKNGYMAHLPQVESPHSKFREAIVKKLVALKLVAEYKVESTRGKKIVVKLSYPHSQAALTDVEIVSRPGSRIYISSKKLKPVLSGMGYAVLSTPQGIMTGSEARKAKIGGELLFKIW